MGALKTLPSVAQLMTRSRLAVRHVEPETADHEWRATERCPRCRGPILTLRRGSDYVRQEEHTPTCGKNA